MLADYQNFMLYMVWRLKGTSTCRRLFTKPVYKTWAGLYTVTMSTSSISYDKRHGGPYDRGSADSYYGRGRNPHYYVGATGSSQRVEVLNADELAAYNAGYNDNEDSGDRKDWGYADDWSHIDD